jgi:hypothetical protein
MKLERGLRRLIVVVSILLLGCGVAFDIDSIRPRAAVAVSVKDGRTFTLERHGPRAKLLDYDSLISALPDEALGPTELLYNEDVLKRLRKAYPEYRDIADVEFTRLIQTKPDVDRPSIKIRSFPDITATKFVRGPEYWWWSDSGASKLAGMLVAGLWAVFYALRWIVRGFTGA